MRGGEAVWRALMAARRANLEQAGDAPPVAGAPGETRRGVLKALGATAAVLALPKRAFALPSGGRVAIIGGGIAGLSALWHLTRAGVDARLYEARGRLGGRMFTARGFDGAMPAEDGGQLVNSNHQDIHALVKEFGLTLVDRKAQPHETIVLANGAPVPEAALAEALRPIAAQIARDARRLDADYGGVAPVLDRLSVAHYLDRHARLIREPWARALLETSCRTEYGAEPDRASALELIFNLPTVNGADVEILGDSDERFVIAGGSGALIDAMASRLGDRIETGRRLERIDSAGVPLRLGFRDGAPVTAEAVILAVPAPLMRDIGYGVRLPALWHSFMREVTLGRNEKLHIGCATRPWTGRLGPGGELWQTDARAGFSLGWDGTIAPAPAGDARGIWTAFLGGDQVAAIEGGEALAGLAGHFVAGAASVLPGLPAAATGPYRRTAWHRDAFTRGAYSCFAPGQLTRYAGLFWVEADDPAERQQAVVGWLSFVGEHLSDAWAGFMNGGAQTGRLAAEALVAARLERAA